MAVTQFPPTALEPRVFCKAAQMFLSLTTARSFLPTHQPISRETDTNTKYMPSSPSNSFFPPFSSLSQLDAILSCPPLISQDTHSGILSQKDSRLPTPFRKLLCSVSSNLLKRLIKTSGLTGATVLSCQTLSIFPCAGRPPGVTAKQTQSHSFSNIITPSKLQAVLNLSSQFNPGFFGVEHGASGPSCKRKRMENESLCQNGEL